MCSICYHDYKIIMIHCFVSDFEGFSVFFLGKEIKLKISGDLNFLVTDFGF